MSSYFSSTSSTASATSYFEYRYKHPSRMEIDESDYIKEMILKSKKEAAEREKEIEERGKPRLFDIMELNIDNLQEILS